MFSSSSGWFFDSFVNIIAWVGLKSLFQVGQSLFLVFPVGARWLFCSWFMVILIMLILIILIMCSVHAYPLFVVWDIVWDIISMLNLLFMIGVVVVCNWVVFCFMRQLVLDGRWYHDGRS